MKQLLTTSLIILSFHAFSQNVGIGETVPNMKLQVKASDSAVMLLHNSTTAAANVKTALFWKTGNYYSGSISTIATNINAFRLGFFTFGATDPSLLAERMSILDNGNIGINSINPTVKFEVAGQMKLNDGSQGSGKLLQSDGTGIASWVDKSASLVPAGVTGNTLRNSSGSWVLSNLIYNNGTSVGINTTTPNAAYIMDINGRPRLRYNGSTAGIWYNKADNTEAVFAGMYDDSIYGLYHATNGWQLAMDTKNARIGIDNFAPTVPLSFATVLGKKISMYHGSSGDAGFGVFGNEMRISSDYSGADITFGYDDYTAGFTERMRVKGNGNVNIGPVSTAAKMSVFENTGTNSRGMYIGMNNGLSGNEGLRVESLSGTNGTAILAYRNSSTGNAIAASSNGGVAVDVFSGSGGGDVGLRANAGVGLRGTTSASAGGIGVFASANGVASNIAVYSAGQAYIGGDMNVVGTLSKSAGSFKIDHPLDPANKFLYHSFVESPDMMNVYNGIAVTDADGFVKVALPDYFDALNIDFKYQLTIVGKEFARALVYEEITNNHFVIRTDKPNIKVSWQVTGIRNDAYAKKHPIIPEVEKTGDQKGKYLWPGLFGQTEDKKINKRD